MSQRVMWVPRGVSVQGHMMTIPLIDSGSVKPQRPKSSTGRTEQES